MSKLEDQKWSDFKGRFQNHYCPLCQKQTLMFSDPHFGEVAGLDVVAVSCSNCAHVELFNIAEVTRIADDINKEYIQNHWR